MKHSGEHYLKATGLWVIMNIGEVFLGRMVKRFQLFEKPQIHHQGVTYFIKYFIENPSKVYLCRVFICRILGISANTFWGG